MLPSAKDITSLARLCRKLGITHYKCGDLELHFTQEAPVKPNRAKKVQTEEKQDLSLNQDILDENELTESQLLLWSTADPSSEIYEGNS